MLDVLRRNAGSWAIKFILSFIALTFIWWGVGSYSQSQRDVAATIGEEKVSMAELAEATAGLEKTYREVYGNAFTPEMAKALDLRRQALDTLVRRKLMLAEAEKMGRSARTGIRISSPTTGFLRGNMRLPGGRKSPSGRWRAFLPLPPGSRKAKPATSSS